MHTYTTAPSREQADLHHAICNVMARTHPKTLTIRDYLNVIARIQGQLLAACYPEERPIAREESLANMDHAMEEFTKIEPNESRRRDDCDSVVSNLGDQRRMGSRNHDPFDREQPMEEPTRA